MSFSPPVFTLFLMQSNSCSKINQETIKTVRKGVDEKILVKWNFKKWDLGHGLD
jgi:hypothetical protein